MIQRNDPCWCHSGKKWKKCHYPSRSLEANPLAKKYLDDYGIILKNRSEIEGIRQASIVTAQILDEICLAAREGVSTEALDQLSISLHRKAHAIPASLGYGDPPYPKTICISLNEVICHGIPNSRPLEEGDILNIDVSSILNGYIGDCSRMVKIGTVSEEKNRVVDVSLECLNRAIGICQPGVPISKIGETIEDYAKLYNCSVVNQFVGHGIGIFFHEPPEIPHHYNSLKILMTPGMVFTIEPMINAGVRDGVLDPIDHWTVRTKDGRPSAQWEHTILITETGHEILTRIGRETVPAENG